jgi:hypothetical protein
MSSRTSYAKRRATNKPHNKRPSDASQSSNVLNILAFNSHACLLPCWLSWLSQWLNVPSTIEYRFEMKTYTSPPGLTGKDRWRNVVNEKVSFVLSALDKLPDGAQVLFSDLDVVLFRPPSLLLPLPFDMTFMREPPGHGGKTGRHIVNTGLFAVRNRWSVRSVIGHWKWLLKQRDSLLHDQDVANWVLLAKPGTGMHHKNVSWGTWPAQVATGQVEDVTDATVAFHAIFTVTDDEKLARIGKAFERHAAAAATLARCQRMPQMDDDAASDIAKGGPNASSACRLAPAWPPHAAVHRGVDADDVGGILSRRNRRRRADP